MKYSKIVFSLIGILTILAAMTAASYKVQSVKDAVETQRNVLEKMAEYFYKKRAINADMYETYLKGHDGDIDYTAAKPAYLSLYYGNIKDYKRRDDLLMIGLSSYTAPQLSNMLEANLPVFDVAEQSRIIALAQMPSASAADIHKALNSTATYLKPDDINKLQRCYAIMSSENVRSDSFVYLMQITFGMHIVSNCSKI